MKELTAAISLIYSMPFCRIVSLKEDKVFLASTKEERYVLKLLPYPMAECRFITDAMEYLGHSGFHNYNEIIPTATGRPCGEFRGYRTLLTKELKGRVPSYKKREDLRAVAVCLGELHQAATGFFPIHRFEARNRWGTWLSTMTQSRDELTTLRELIAEKEQKTDFDRAYLEHCEGFIQEIEEAMAGLMPVYPRLCDEKRRLGGFCHHDPAYHNFLIDHRGKAGVFDFDYVIADSAAHDTAALILKTAKADHWDITAAHTVLRAYLEIAPMTAEERKLIYWLMRYPYDFHHAAFARYREHNEQRRIEKKLFRQIRNRERRETFLGELKTMLWEGT